MKLIILAVLAILLGVIARHFFPPKSSRSAPNLGLGNWGQWPAEVHEMPEQVKRKGQWHDCWVKGAQEEYIPFKLSDSVVHVNGYKTSLDSCSCADFKKRNLPCKHMYYLLGLLDHNMDYIELTNRSDSWGNWDKRLHLLKPQKERIHRSSETTLNSLDEKASTAKINDYAVSLTTCTCPDFKERQVPCAHIYRLASKLGMQ